MESSPGLGGVPSPCRSVMCQGQRGRKRASLAVSEGPGRGTGLQVAGEEEMEGLIGCRRERSPWREQSQGRVQGLSNEQGDERVGHSAYLLYRKFPSLPQKTQDSFPSRHDK